MTMKFEYAMHNVCIEGKGLFNKSRSKYFFVERVLFDSYRT